MSQLVTSTDFFLRSLQPARQLRGRSGFARALQTGHQYHGRRLDIQIQFITGFTHDADQLIIDDLDQRLARGQALQIPPARPRAREPSL